MTSPFLTFNFSAPNLTCEANNSQDLKLAFSQFKKHDAELAKNNQAPLLELTYNWDSEAYSGGRNFGHLAFEVDDIYSFCQQLMDSGVTINRPPRDGYMAFIRSPDQISIELLQKGKPLTPAEPWASMENIGSW